MPVFNYEASTAAGKIINSAIEADSARHARTLLKEQGLIVLEVSSTSTNPSKINIKNKSNFKVKTKVKPIYVIDFTRQLATLLNSGLPIDQALILLSQDDSADKKLQTIIAEIKAGINEGKSFAKCLLPHEYSFNNLYISLVEAGEESGKLDIIMLELAEYLEQKQKLKEQVQQAFIYPAIVSFIALCIIIFLLTYVIPQVVGVFSKNNQKLPLLTEIMLAISAFLKDYGIYLAIAILLLVVLVNKILKNSYFKYKFHVLLLKLPLIKTLELGYNSNRFSSTMAILSNAGVPILRSLQASSNTLSNVVLKSQIEQASEQITQGASLSFALKTSSFPKVMQHLIKTGENTGKLPSMLTKIASVQSEQLKKYCLFLTTLLEPALVLFMGAVVMLIVLAVLLPIMDLNYLVK
jgi:general secretion pathway protein F